MAGRRLPPLNNLRTFEAAARHGSFRAASDELHVTPSAVSHGVQGLEDFLGVRLFHRIGRGLDLTDAGRAYANGLRGALDAMEIATRQVMERGVADRLTIACAPSFARAWLLPRLAGFREAFPDIELRVHALMRAIDFRAEEVDVGILYGKGDWPGATVELLLEEVLVPLISPTLLARHKLDQPDDLVAFTLIHTETKITNWDLWLAAAGVKAIRPKGDLRFNRSTFSLEAAKNGLGVALESLTLARDYIERGELVVALQTRITGAAAGAYWLVHPKAEVDPPKLARFKAWIHQAAA